MRLVFVENSELPPLAWCARIRHGSSEVVVRCGTWVETGDGLFFEGAWGGDFEFFEFDRAIICAGSGAKLTKDGIVFVSPTNTMERLHLLAVKDELLVSNSLAFLLVEADDSYDPDYPFYGSDLQSIIHGLRHHATFIPTLHRNRVHLFYHCNFLVRESLRFKEIPKSAPELFRGYEEYVAFLQSGMISLCRNADAPQRKVRYTPLSTISSGYDSPACSVLARRAGCSEAVTFYDARPGSASLDDSGKQVAEHLGLQIKEFKRLAYQEIPGFPEAEFLAYGTYGEDVVFTALKDILPRRLFITGFHGDKVWDRNNPEVSQRIVRGDPSGGSLFEFRLRLGFIHAAVPFFGCVRHPEIHAISTSPAMLPWSTGNDYDRPIPRRLVETAGIPREYFGQGKKVISQPFNQPLNEVMRQESYRDFQTFSINPVAIRSSSGRLTFSLFHLLYRINLRVVWRACKRPLASWLERLQHPIVPERYKEYPSVNVLTFHWGIEKTMARYRSGGASAERLKSTCSSSFEGG